MNELIDELFCAIDEIMDLNMDLNAALKRENEKLRQETLINVALRRENDKVRQEILRYEQESIEVQEKSEMNGKASNDIFFDAMDNIDYYIEIINPNV